MRRLAVIFALVLAAALSAGVMSAEAARAIATGNATVRTGPSTDYRSVGRLVRGEAVRVTRCNRPGTWCRVDRRRGRDGWVRARYLTHRGVGGPSWKWDGRRPPRSVEVCFDGAAGRICVAR